MNKKKWVKYILLILAIIIIVGFLLSLYIKHRVAEKIASLPDVTCEQIDLNLFSGCLDLEMLHIKRAIGQEKLGMLQLQTSKVHLHGFSYWQFLKNNKIGVRELSFDDLDLAIKENTIPIEKDNVKNDSSSTQNIAEVLIENIDIPKGKFTLENKTYEKIEVDSFVLKLEDIHYIPNDSQQIRWKNIEFLGNKLVLDNKESDNRLLIANINLTKKNQLTLKDLNWKPKRSKDTYLNGRQYRKSRLRLIVPKIEVQQFPIQKLIFNQQIKIQSIIAEEASLQIYNDKNKPACPDCLKRYPYENMITADLGIDIDSILVKNSRLILEELGKDKDKIGKLDWTKLYASIYHLTNNPEKKKSHPYMVADIQANFVRDAHTKVHFEFPNFNKNADYLYRGSIDEIQLKKINRFLVFSKRLRIKQGLVTGFNFSGRGNLQNASGDMELRYKGLELELLKKDRTPRKFLSGLINGLISKKNNPDKDNKLRKGKMYSERAMEKSFFSNWWQTLQSGLKSTMLPNIFLPEELEHTDKKR